MDKRKTTVDPYRPNRGNILALSCRIEGLAKTVAALAKRIALLEYRVRCIEDVTGRVR